MLNDDDKKKVERLRAELAATRKQRRAWSKPKTQVDEDVPIASGPQNQKEWNKMVKDIEDAEKEE